ncbi:hypothetical protein Zmor_008801 [Zophobas morio]|uniref:Uncharacterized protein n=1 Tax=Zophobas morio TaxID=2755281 RepID=A0AA38M0N8_9CUCU|nr:hypothetical protein Zmor_008801 [Zophobas morio]
MQHLADLGRPFALFMPLAQMLETKERQTIYKRLGLQILHPNKRTAFYSAISKRIEGTPTFVTAYLCYGILQDHDIEFADFNQQLIEYAKVEPFPDIDFECAIEGCTQIGKFVRLERKDQKGKDIKIQTFRCPEHLKLETETPPPQITSGKELN